MTCVISRFSIVIILLQLEKSHLQDQVTRLNEENSSLKQSLQSSSPLSASRNMHKVAVPEIKLFFFNNYFCCLVFNFSGYPFWWWILSVFLFIASCWKHSLCYLLFCRQKHLMAWDNFLLYILGVTYLSYPDQNYPLYLKSSPDVYLLRFRESKMHHFENGA